MSPYRGSDEELEREISAVQGMVRVRLRRTTADLRELETALRELRRELKRRRGALVGVEAEAPSESASA